MEADIKALNQIITDFENSREISAAELDLLETAVCSGALYGISKKGYPLLGMRAKTKLFESNFYLLEAVRILALNGRMNRMQIIIDKIIEGLHSKCFGRFCAAGECYETSVCVLRFLRAVSPAETEWISKMEEGIIQHRNDRVRTKAVQMYIESAL